MLNLEKISENMKKSKKTSMRQNGFNIVFNKSARFDYEILEDFEAGIVLVGSEVKSLRLYNPNFNDTYASFTGGELFLKNFNIPSLEYAKLQPHDPMRFKKLLMHKNELVRLNNKLVKGLTIVPLSVYFNKRGLIKVQLGLARGKKEFDKRQDIKNKDLKREVARDMKNFVLR